MEALPKDFSDSEGSDRSQCEPPAHLSARRDPIADAYEEMVQNTPLPPSTNGEDGDDYQAVDMELASNFGAKF